MNIIVSKLFNGLVRYFLTLLLLFIFSFFKYTYKHNFIITVNLIIHYTHNTPITHYVDTL